MLNRHHSPLEDSRSASGLGQATSLVSKAGFLVVAACPIVFLFAMMQMSALTVPFWDHWGQLQSIKTYYDQGLQPAIWNVLQGKANHARPVTSRMIFLINAILTRWSVASEYVYMYIAMALTLLVLYRFIRKLAVTPSLTVKEAALFSIMAIFYCSPANHNVHWWSFMLALNLNHLLSLLALLLIAFHPRRWRTNVVAAALCWLSAYTFTNGLFLILVVAGLSQIASATPFRPGKTTAFWAANIALLYWTYFPIDRPQDFATHPALPDFFAFILMNIGNPLAELIHFSFQNQFEPAAGTTLSIVCGFLTAPACFAMLIARRKLFRNPPAHFLILIGFGAFTLLSAAAVGWTRGAFDQYGIRNGNNSRYVMTGTYIVFGMLYFMFADGAKLLAWAPRLSLRSRVLAGLCVYALFIALSARSYAASVKIYEEARDFNIRVSRGFPPDASPTSVDQYLFPNTERLIVLRRDLLRLRIGPYRETGNAIPAGRAVTQTLSQQKLIDQFGINGMRDEGGLQFLFAHPHSQFALPVDGSVHAVDFRYGMLDGALTTTPTPGPVEFLISFHGPGTRPERVWSVRLDPAANQKDRGPHNASVTPPGAGQLIFETIAVGPLQNLWTYWSDVVIR